MKKYVTVRELMEILSVTRNTAMRCAERCGAVVHIGRCVRIDMVAIENAVKEEKRA